MAFSERAGTYRLCSAASEAIKAFLPRPLPPDPPLVLDDGHRELAEKATLALGRLDGITALFPQVPLFLYSYVRKEAVLSSQIEGTQSSFSDLLLFENQGAPGVPLDDVQEVSNYVAAMTYGLERLHEGFPLSLRLIRRFTPYCCRTGAAAQKAPGEFRRSQNWIGGTRPGTARFVPPPPDASDGLPGGAGKVPAQRPGAHADTDQGGAGPRAV